MEKRKDKRGRVLRTGEGQCADGRYYYKYKNGAGKWCYYYSWKLDSGDPAPKGGRRDKPSIREQKKKIEKDLLDGIVPNGGEMSVLQLVQKYILQKRGVRHNTEAGYKTVVNILKQDAFGGRRIDTIKQSDAKEWLIQLQENGRSYSSIKSIRGVVRPAFRMAVDDDLIRKNPFDFQLVNLLVDDSVTRKALTKAQERLFLEFVKQDKHFSKYYDGIFILFKTGLRISEFVGLTVSDIDLVKREIKVDHQLQRMRNMEYIIEGTKTEAGTRVLPMSDAVYECFSRIIKNRKAPENEPVIQGRTGFLYFDKNGNPLVAMHWEKYFQHIRAKYNKIYKEELPVITPHVCRHTYCTNMMKGGMNPACVKELMGHSTVETTFDTYTHVNYDDLKDAVKKLKVS